MCLLLTDGKKMPTKKSKQLKRKFRIDESYKIPTSEKEIIAVSSNDGTDDDMLSLLITMADATDESRKRRRKGL